MNIINSFSDLSQTIRSDRSKKKHSHKIPIIGGYLCLLNMIGNVVN